MSTPTKRRTSTGSSALSNPIVVGSIILLVGIVGVVLSYSANRGLPFVPTYDIRAEVPDAAELIEGSSEVRIGGSRVGIVKTIEAIPAKGDRRAYALLNLALDEDQTGLPTDSTVQVRPRSILGAKFVDLTRGTSERVLARGGTLPIRQAIAGVQLDEAFSAFNPETRDALQRAVTNLGDALAGRGGDFNEAIAATRRLIAPLQRVLRVIVAPDTELDEFLAGAAGATRAIAPVATELAALVDDAATTAAAVNAAGPQLDRALEVFPSTAQAGTRAALAAGPVLRDAASIARDIGPGIREVGPASRALRPALREAGPVLRRVPALARRLDATLISLDRLSRRPTTSPTLLGLTATVTSLDKTLDALLPAQLACNTGPLYVRNLASTVSEGDEQASWLSFVPLFDLEQTFQQSRQSPNLHANPRPNNNASECETGNEPFEPGRRVGSPGGTQPNRTEETAPPASATARARAAGLLTLPRLAR